MSRKGHTAASQEASKVVLSLDVSTSSHNVTEVIWRLDFRILHALPPTEEEGIFSFAINPICN